MWLPSCLHARFLSGSRRARAEGKDPVEPLGRGPNLALHELRNSAALTPLHNLCGNFQITYVLLKYMLEEVVCPCKFYQSATW